MKKCIFLVLLCFFVCSCTVPLQSNSSQENSDSASANASSLADVSAAMSEDNGTAFYLEGTRLVEEKTELSCMQYYEERSTAAMSVKSGRIRWDERLYEETGVRINYEFIPNSKWAEKIQLTFASEEYPDLIIGTSDVDREEYGVKQHILRHWDDLLAYMPIYRERLEKDPFCSYPLISSDGQMYTMGSIADDGVRLGNHSWFINQKWLDKAGLDIPETTDELLEALRIFRAEDEKRIGYEAVFDEMTTDIFCCFGIPEVAEHITINEDNQVLFTPEMDRYREGVEFLNTMYSEELMDPNNVTQDMDSKIAVYNQNNLGLATMDRLQGMGWDILMEDMVYMLPPAADGCSVQIAQTLTLAQAKAYITVTNPYPLISARLMDIQLEEPLCWDSFYGSNFWAYSDEGKCQLQMLGDGAMSDGLGIYGIYYFPSYLYNDLYEQPEYRMEQIGYHRIVTENGSYNSVPITFATRLPHYSEEEKNERNAIFAEIEAIYDASVANMIVNGVSDDSWNTLLDQLRAAGSERYVEIYQKGLDEVAADLE